MAKNSTIKSIANKIATNHDLTKVYLSCERRTTMVFQLHGYHNLTLENRDSKVQLQTKLRPWL